MSFLSRHSAAGALALAALAVLSGCNLRYLAGIPHPEIRVAGAGPIALPFREAGGGLVVVTGRVNGLRDVEFILDTGAPVTVLLDGPRTAGLGLDTSGASKLGRDDDPSAPHGVIRGGFAIAFGPVRLEKLHAVLVPMSTLPCAERFEAIGFGGVIGADLFRRFVVEIDREASLLRLHDPGDWHPANARSVPLVFEDGHPYVDAGVRMADGQEVAARLHLDSGMNQALTLTAGAHPAFTMPASGKAAGGCFVAGRVEAREGAPVSLTLGGATLGPVTPTYAVQPASSRSRRVGAVGAGLLRGQRVAIDYPGKRLLLVD